VRTGGGKEEEEYKGTRKRGFASGRGERERLTEGGAFQKKGKKGDVDNDIYGRILRVNSRWISPEKCCQSYGADPTKGLWRSILN